MTAGVVAAACAASAAQAAVIENTAGVFDASIAAFSPLGQTFTAIDTDLISIGFAYSDINPGSPNEPITLRLYAGDGVGGTLLASRIFTLPSVLPSTLDAPVIVDTDFSGVSLTVGAIYTAALSTSSFKVAAVYGGERLRRRPRHPEPQRLHILRPELPRRGPQRRERRRAGAGGVGPDADRLRRARRLAAVAPALGATRRGRVIERTLSIRPGTPRRKPAGRFCSRPRFQSVPRGAGT